MEKLKSNIENNLAPETWESQGGPGRLVAWEDSLVVYQTEAVHAQIELWLKQQRDKAGR